MAFLDRDPPACCPYNCPYFLSPGCPSILLVFFLISSPWVLKSDVEKTWVLPAILWCHLMTDPVQHAKRDPTKPKAFWCPLKPLAQKHVCKYVIFAHSSTNWHCHLQGTRADLDSELPSSPVWRACYLQARGGESALDKRLPPGKV